MSINRVSVGEEQEVHLSDSVDLGKYAQYLRDYEHSNGMRKESENAPLNKVAIDDIFK